MLRSDFEIMAPVGSRESLYAAFQAGADAVYFGVGKLNMRAHSANAFTIEDLREIAELCREKGVKSYLTVNTIVYDEELDEMRRIVDAAKAADDLKSALTFQDELSEATQELRDRTYGISADDVVSGKLYLSSGATAEEIAVFEAKDDAAAERLLAAAKERVEAQKTAFEDYAPAEMTKLNNAVVERNGKIVALCIADDSSAAQKKVKELIG